MASPKTLPASEEGLADLTPPAPLSPQSARGSSTLRERGRNAEEQAGLPNALWLFGLAALLSAARPLLYDTGLTPLLHRGLASQPPVLGSTPLGLSFAAGHAARILQRSGDGVCALQRSEHW